MGLSRCETSAMDYRGVRFVVGAPGAESNYGSIKLIFTSETLQSCGNVPKFMPTISGSISISVALAIA